MEPGVSCPIVKPRKPRTRKARSSVGFVPPPTVGYDPTAPALTGPTNGGWAPTGANDWPIGTPDAATQAAIVSQALTQFNLANYGTAEPPSYRQDSAPVFSPSSPSYYPTPAPVSTKAPTRSPWLASSAKWAARRKALTAWARPFARWKLDGAPPDRHLAAWTADFDTKTSTHPLSDDRRALLLELDPRFFETTLPELRGRAKNS